MNTTNYALTRTVYSRTLENWNSFNSTQDIKVSRQCLNINNLKAENYNIKLIYQWALTLGLIFTRSALVSTCWNLRAVQVVRVPPTEE